MTKEELYTILPTFNAIRVEDMTKAPHNMWDSKDVSFTTTFNKIKENTYEEVYGTSDFDDYCHVYGIFRSCNNCKKVCIPDIVDCNYISNFISEIEDEYDIHTIIDNSNNTLHIWYR